jgi:RNA polymerase sigma-70 factor, ECF subfamily
MSQTPRTEQGSNSSPYSWTANRMAPSRSRAWPKNSESGSQRLRNVAGTANGRTGREEWGLIQRARAGDAEALSTLFTRNRSRLYRTALSLLRNKEDAEDALQDGLLRAYLHLGSFEGRARFSTWLTRIVINSALMRRRRIHAHSILPLEEFIATDDVHRTVTAIDHGPDPEQLLAQHQTWAFVEEGISRLSPCLRSALVLRDIQDLSSREAATLSRVKVNVIKSRLLRARRRLANLVTTRKKFVPRPSSADASVQPD